MATIVCLERNNEIKTIRSTVYKIYDIVDGQQRLTTLVALLKAISLALNEGSDEEREDAKDLEKLLVKGENNDLVLLQTNHNEAEIFREYLRFGTIPPKEQIKTLAEKNLYELFTGCKREVALWKSKVGPLIDLLFAVKNSLEFILHLIDDEAIVYTVFEVLNSRGLEVNWLDKSKSALMGIVYEKFGNQHNTKEYISQLQFYWSEIYNVLGIKDLNGDEILTFAATLILPDREKGKLLSTQASLDLFKQLSTENIDNVLYIAKTILILTKKYKELSDIKQLKFFYSISQARYLYVAIMANEVLTENDKKEILLYWEKVTFRIYGMMDRDVKKKVGDYIKLGREIFQNRIKNPISPRDNRQKYHDFEAYSFKEKIIFRIEQIGKDSPVEKAALLLIGKDCYTSWQDELKYFFYKYEKYIANERNATIREEVWLSIFDSSPLDTVEHIIPQKDPRGNWTDVISNGELVENVNRLGNLVILPPLLNSRAGTQNFTTKKQVYKDALLHIVNDVIFRNYISKGDWEERQEWTKQTIDQRDTELVEIAMKIWS